MATQVKSLSVTPKGREHLKPAPQMVQAMPKWKPPSPDEIRMAAYIRWDLAGKPPGDGVRFWLEAERALLDSQ
jgi:hypothetical protein